MVEKTMTLNFNEFQKLKEEIEKGGYISNNMEKIMEIRQMKLESLEI